ncbi:glycosyltransferase family 4 protein [Acaryochloris marina]|uniref:glycosyltransferase family 4 protein n=1 Tax=Acaryochloris marina TaxID=155978 RepID=UPI001BAE5D2A|nr:glycosyltransferase family 4 protein [Acaryochloris marina]QUY42724.1 glycosyltransferase family 4 protein [Acaryochloris marina S15]
MTSVSTIALLPWGNVIEDFLDPLDISLKAFQRDMTGGWLFGYIEALQKVNIHSVLICISAQVRSPMRSIHQPTGAVIWTLPSPSVYLAIRHQMVNPYGLTAQATFGHQSPWWIALRNLVPYLATPWRSLAKVIQQEHCNALLCQEYEYARFDISIWLGKRLNIPVFASFQGGDFQITQLERYVRPTTLRACSGLIIGSQQEINRVMTCYNVPQAKIAKIYNPLNLEQWATREDSPIRQHLGIATDAQVVAWHGRVDLHRKGLDVLLQAWQCLCQDHPTRDLQLLLVGTGSDADTLQQLLDDTQMANIHWVNEYILDKPTIRNYLVAADLYVLPSRHEGFAVALIEAMACQLPVVATDVPGVSEAVISGADPGGVVVPVEDPHSLAAAMGQLLEDDALRLQFAYQAYQRAQSLFSIEAIGRQLRSFLSPINTVHL